MKKIALAALGAALLASVASVSVAEAKVYDWSYSRIDGGGGGSGTFDASATLPAAITGVTGTLSDSDLNSGAPLAVTGLSFTLGGDDTIYALGLDTGDVSFGGVTFVTSAGDLNLFTNPSLSTGLGFVLNSVTSPSGAPGAFTYAVNYSIVAAPEVSTWAMMGLGFAGLAFAGYRGRRSSAAIA